MLMPLCQQKEKCDSNSILSVRKDERPCSIWIDYPLLVKINNNAIPGFRLLLLQIGFKQYFQHTLYSDIKILPKHYIKNVLSCMITSQIKYLTIFHLFYFLLHFCTFADQLRSKLVGNRFI